MKNFEINLSLEELEKRTHKDYLNTKKMLEVDAPEFETLADGDKKALKHLVKAASLINDVFLQQDNKYNMKFREFLKSQNSDKKSEMTLKLFTAQQGVVAIDAETNYVVLLKGEKETLSKNLYPRDLEPKEFHKILIKMIKTGKIENVKKILNQRSIIERCGDELIAIDYVDKFSNEFLQIANELEKASEYSTNSDFNEFLKLQANALRKADPMLDAYADKKWATLQDTPLEFTISRENYADEMTQTVIENEELNELLKSFNINPISKDFLGCRVGIVNKKGTQALLAIKKYLPLLAQNMPFAETYEQNISPDKETKQTMVDVDLVMVAGDEGAYRGGITLAQNLPNDDKMSIEIGGGRRNVYHRQIRKISEPEKLQKRLDVLLDKKFHKYYNDEADHWFTIGHENAHSLGPNGGTEALGKYQSIIEENKADMGALAFLDILVEKGMYTNEQKEQMIVTFAADNFLKSKPNLSQAHRVRSVMQTHYFTKNGAIFIEGGFLKINIDKMISTAKQMLSDIVKIQLSKDFEQAEKYVSENFIWSEEMELIANKLKEVNKTLNGCVDAPLAKYLLGV